MGPGYPRDRPETRDGGAPFSARCVIEDASYKGQHHQRPADGMSSLGKDEFIPAKRSQTRFNDPKQPVSRISGGNGYDGSGYFVQIADGEDITIANKYTVLNTGNIATLQHDAAELSATILSAT